MRRSASLPAQDAPVRRVLCILPNRWAVVSMWQLFRKLGAVWKQTKICMYVNIYVLWMKMILIFQPVMLLFSATLTAVLNLQRAIILASMQRQKCEEEEWGHWFDLQLRLLKKKKAKSSFKSCSLFKKVERFIGLSIMQDILGLIALLVQTKCSNLKSTISFWVIILRQ